MSSRPPGTKHVRRRRVPPGSSVTKPSSLDRMQAIGTLLLGVAALAALLFTWQSVRATNSQLQISEQGQITDRYNAAISNLGSSSIDIRLGGIYALQRIMEDSPRDQPTVVAVLCAFVRDHNERSQSTRRYQPPTDIQSALTVIGTRNPTQDGSTTVIDLDHTELSGANLVGVNLAHANLDDADLSGAFLGDANLASVELIGTYGSGADLPGAQLTDADFSGSDFDGATLSGADLSGAQFNATNLTQAHLTRANLTHAFLGAILTGADLTRANLSYADLRYAEDLLGANLSGADLTGAERP